MGPWCVVVSTHERGVDMKKMLLGVVVAGSLLSAATALAQQMNPDGGTPLVRSKTQRCVNHEVIETTVFSDGDHASYPVGCC
jgi:hypothetical protein